jgi:hypothetical protein
MKTILHSRLASILILLLAFSSSVQSQTIPELIFKNPTLLSAVGTEGNDGAQYLFKNVGPNLDAVVTIISRSSSQVVLGSIDTVGAGLGYDKSFQPVVGIPGTAPANTNWWMKFNITFFEGGSTINKARMSQFNVTGLDIDGDASALYEWAQMDRVEKIDSAAVNSLSFSMISAHGQEWDYRVTGVVANSPGIDTTALNVMATYTYKNKDNFDFTIGAQTTNNTTTAGMRLNSLWFKQFSLSSLPLKMVSFAAILNNNKADLTWKTVAESNVSHFVVEKSFDGKEFNQAGIVFARGNETDITVYTFTDVLDTDKAGVVYYRIRSVDIDGKFDLSGTRIIRFGNQSKSFISILTYPNPATNEIRVTIPANWQKMKIRYEIFSLNGQSVLRKEATSSSQTEVLNIANLQSGVYVVRVTGGGETAQQKIIKN